MVNAEALAEAMQRAEVDKASPDETADDSGVHERFLGVASL
jgi:hypothetical protein